MRSIVIGFFVVLLGGCSKKDMVRPKASVLDDGGVSVVPRPRLPALLPLVLDQCVNSYPDLVTTLGGSQRDVLYVLLEDGTRISVGWPIGYMRYRVIEKQERYSLFRSELAVWHAVDGYQSYWDNNSWSLGCIYMDAGIQPFTNLKIGEQVLLINASLTWGLAPHVGKRIAYLILE